MKKKLRDDHTIGETNIPRECELNIHLEEYKTLSSQILKRVDFQQRLLNYQLIVTGIIATVGIKLLTLDYTIPINATLAQYFLLLSPMLFYFFSWSFSNHDTMIVSIARYINVDLRPRIKELVGGKDILRFENFLQNERMHRAKIFGILPVFGEEYLLHRVRY
ncbi:MAG: hypothetical protein U9N18_05895 [Campylobacterota bacterium]|nr:hypothetical protein [Campylobacterota bacterium]